MIQLSRMRLLKLYSNCERRKISFQDTVAWQLFQQAGKSIRMFAGEKIAQAWNIQTATDVTPSAPLDFDVS